VNNLCNVGGGTSDRRLKNTICPITYGLNQISQLKPVSFCWNNDNSCTKKYGFIAQEVYESIPEIINHHPIDVITEDGKVAPKTEAEGDAILQFEKEAIWAGYVNAIRELKDRLEIVEADNITMKAEIELLKTK
jgi:hypothetical protein